MAKDSNRKAKAIHKDEQMTGAMNFFLTGCVAELYLLIVRRFYINAASDLVRFAWYDRYLWILAGIGFVLMAAGIAVSVMDKAHPQRRMPLLMTAGLGGFVGLASLLIRWNLSTLSLMTIVVPVVMLLGILWALYDRECALALTVLGVSLLALWGLRRYGPSMYVGGVFKGGVVVYLLLLAALVYLCKNGKLAALLPSHADKKPVYAACGLSAVALLAGLLISGVAYYAMWALAAVLFALAVYYTVKQL